MKHELKIWPQNYARVADGSMTFQVRDNDREFQQGDSVTLKEWDPTPINANSEAPKGFTESPNLEFKIGHVQVLGSRQVVFGLIPIKTSKSKA